MHTDYVWFIFLAFGKHRITSLTQALSKGLSELPACYYVEVICLHVSNAVKTFGFSKHRLYFFNFRVFFNFFFTCELLSSTVSQ